MSEILANYIKIKTNDLQLMKNYVRATLQAIHSQLML